MHSSSKQRQTGFSLIEALVSLVVISVGMIGIAALYGQGLGAGRTALYRTIAVNLASDMADRIRVNRLGGAAYAGMPANNECDPETGGGRDCTPAEMAAHDLFVWTNEVAARLPNGVGTVDFAAGEPATYTVNVSWQEVGIGELTHQLTLQLPEF
jgi:type IV pilus assembly protein PilV